jgi:hypothetical protein
MTASKFNNLKTQIFVNYWSVKLVTWSCVIMQECVEHMAFQ